jgi:hypothetical protein
MSSTGIMLVNAKEIEAAVKQATEATEKATAEIAKKASQSKSA